MSSVSGFMLSVQHHPFMFTFSVTAALHPDMVPMACRMPRLSRVHVLHFRA